MQKLANSQEKPATKANQVAPAPTNKVSHKATPQIQSVSGMPIVQVKVLKDRDHPAPFVPETTIQKLFMTMEDPTYSTSAYYTSVSVMLLIMVSSISFILETQPNMK